MLDNRRGVVEGMTVRSSDGDKLGKVVFCGDETFHIEKGFFFPKDYTVRYDAVANIIDDEVILAYTKDALTETNWGSSSRDTASENFGATAGSTTYGDINTVSGTSTGYSSSERYGATSLGNQTSSLRSDLNTSGISSMRQSEEIRVPLVEEELLVNKRTQEAGEIRVRKEVVTETKQIEVPVKREEVIVERVQVSDTSRSLSGATGLDDSGMIAGQFEEKVISVPVMEEEIEIRKRPVVKEELRIKKTVHEEERLAEATIRKETAHVEEEGNVTTSSDSFNTMPPPISTDKTTRAPI